MGNIISHGIKAVALGTVKGVIMVSYWPCIVLCMGGTLFYMAGMKKGCKIATGSMLTYIILQALKLGLM